MNTITADAALVARCGLYCGACRSYLKGKCPGCAGNDKATWCSIRTCCRDKAIASCAQCAEFSDPMRCGKFNNLISKMFGLIFRSDRAACVAQIKALGLEGHAKAMAERKSHTIKKG